MFKLGMVFILSSCAYLGLVKFHSNEQGLKDAIVYKKNKIKECSENRPPWHSKLTYKVKVSVLINKAGEQEKLYIQSLPALGSGMKKCLAETFSNLKFTDTDRATKVSQIFKIKSLL